MNEITICSACGMDTFIIFRTSIECAHCAKSYNFNDARLVSEIVDLVKDMNEDN